MKLLFIFGTRPEAIKLAPVIECARQNKSIKTLVCLSAQHREMLDQVIDFFGIKADFDLNLMTPNQDLLNLSSTAIKRIGAVIEKVQPDWVIVQGDTTTTFIGALCAFYFKTRVAHVEAGLRTQNKYSPFPEEINRALTSRLADFHFAPTPRAKDFLLKEGIPKNKIEVTGNTGIDALFMTLNEIKHDESEKLKREFVKIDFSKRILLVTGHRRESFGEPFKNICIALKEIAVTFPDVEIVYPVHLNPNVKKTVYKLLNKIHNIHLLKPVEYPKFVWLMKESYVILTDSGGIQEEAPSLKKPVLVMRENSERPEGVSAGVSRIVGTSTKNIVSSVKDIFSSARIYKAMIASKNPYGDGKASQRIIKRLVHLA